MNVFDLQQEASIRRLYTQLGFHLALMAKSKQSAANSEAFYDAHGLGMPAGDEKPIESEAYEKSFEIHTKACRVAIKRAAKALTDVTRAAQNGQVPVQEDVPPAAPAAPVHPEVEEAAEEAAETDVIIQE